MLRVSHDDGERLTNDLSRVQELMEIQNRFFDSMHNSNLSISKFQTPIQAWEDAFSSRNSSLVDADKWADVFENTSEEGWCHENATKEEKNAFEISMILLQEVRIWVLHAQVLLAHQQLKHQMLTK